MIGFLEGIVISKGERHVILNVGGVGYKAFCASSVMRAAKKEERLTIWTHFHARENALELYGFLHQSELEFFEMLIGISGIGPKSALGVLALAPVDTLKRAIASGDTSYLTKVSGIGRKTAEKIVLELKEKLGYGKMSLEFGDLKNDADVLEALVALGYSAQQAREALGEVTPTLLGREERLTAALKMLGK